MGSASELPSTFKPGPPLRPCRAAIFDFDGTLVDTMPLHYEAYRRVFAAMGLELAPGQFYGAIGGTASETIPRFLAGRAATLSVDEIHARKKTVFAELLRAAALPVLEAAKLLFLLRPLMKIGLASSGSRPGIEMMLERLGWADFFDTVVTGEDVSRGKPAPDLFLLAAGRLDTPAADCFVFEDTDDGVAAAQAAGMSVFDVRLAAPTTHPGVP
jgi:HAD superfamily hydrolase (TIGR01509 family)